MLQFIVQIVAVATVADVDVATACLLLVYVATSCCCFFATAVAIHADAAAFDNATEVDAAAACLLVETFAAC